MNGGLARVIVHLSALLAPRALRARWREEWLAELAAQPSLRRAAGAPWDAMLLRVAALGAAARALAAGWRADARQTGRSLAHAPGHATAVVLCLSIGMIVSIAVFSILNALLYGDIPGVVDRQSLARFFVSYESTVGVENLGRAGVVPATSLAISDFDVLASTPNAAVASFAAEGDVRLGVALGDRSVGTTAVFVSADYFPTLRTSVERGRLLSRDDNRPDAAPVAVIGFHLWQERFDGRADIVGQSLLVAGRPVTIVGIAPKRFTGIQPSDVGASPLDYAQLWLPLHLARDWPGIPDEHTAWLDVVARVAPGSTKDQARALTGAPAALLAALRPEARANAAFVVRSHGFGPNDSPVEVLLALALVLMVPLSVLAIACANVANLQLARATRKGREIAVRLALGATRSQIVRLLTFEALVLAFIAGVLGIAGARLAVAAFQDAFPLEIALDGRVIAFTMLICAGATLLSGLAPAWLAARRGNAAELRQAAQSGGLQHGRLRAALVVTQIALSLALLTVCGLFTRSATVVIRDVPASMREIVRADLDVRGINGSHADAARLQRDLLARLAVDARVRAAAIESSTGFRYRAEATAARDSFVAGGSVTPGWVEAAGVRLLSGRAFTDSDRGDVALITDRLARDLAGGDSALGRTILVRRGSDEDLPLSPVTVIGVVTRLPNGPMDFDPDPAIYLPLVEPVKASSLVVRTTNPDALGSELRRLVTSIEPRLSWIPVERADEVYLRDADPITVLAVSMGGFGMIALALAAGGLFAMMAYVVSLRMRELGIRVALGARAGDVVTLVVGQALRLTVYGVAAGLAIAVPLAFALRALFVGVSPVDPLAIAPAIALLVVVSVGAATIPARRAARVDPVVVLRDL